MLLDEVMDAVADRLALIDRIDGRVFAYPPDKVEAPVGIVSYPDAIEFDATYGRGTDMIRGLEVTIVEGRVSDRDARDRMAPYVAGAGPGSVKYVLETPSVEPMPWDDLHVLSVAFDVVTIAGVDYLAATFKIDLAGPGTVT